MAGVTSLLGGVVFSEGGDCGLSAGGEDCEIGGVVPLMPLGLEVIEGVTPPP